MTSGNPYNFNLPVSEEMFFGREKLVSDLYNELMASPGDSIALLGGRRMGKTSVLQALSRKISIENQSSLSLAIPVFIDLSDGEITSPKTFFNKFIELAESQVSAYTPPTRIDKRLSAVSYLKQALPAWVAAISEQTGKSVRFILILDESEKISNKSWTKGLFGSLRSLLIAQETKLLLKLIMAGAYPFMAQVSKDGSPLHNIVKYFTLSNLSKDDTVDLIQKPTGLENSQTVDEIYKSSGGHPFLTQFIMHHLFESIDKATPDAVRTIAQDFCTQRPLDFDEWMRHVGSVGEKLYKEICQASAPVNTKTLIQTVKQPSANLILQALIYYGMVNKAEQGFIPTNNIFRNWFEDYYLPAKQAASRSGTRQRAKNHHPTQYFNGPYYDYSTKTGALTGNTGFSLGAGSSSSVDYSKNGLSADDVTKIFSVIWEKAQQVNSEHKPSVENAIKKLEEEAAKGDGADENKLEAWIGFLADIAPDVFEVAVTTFANPALGLGMVFKKIADKARNKQ